MKKDNSEIIDPKYQRELRNMANNILFNEKMNKIDKKFKITFSIFGIIFMLIMLIINIYR